ncbi:MAG TPA: UDP-N-acetylmuramoyl-tripeptide--D-alanyl-D-alanine ligase [Mollicutes bacterium]|nr:UDP-N-acetylmuramoyl-tripeptide--D-alanyl-D-alanine ligase [Mollicutes bacterium]
MHFKVKDIIDICDGYLYSGDINIDCINFSKDTRTINKGDVYIGIKGDSFDGNSFYLNAFENGASVCILEESFLDNLKDTDKTIIIVKDSIEALRKLATSKLDKSDVKVVAVTGSVGKTSTRDMIYSVVSKKYKTLVTEKNYNNHIGLPLTILRLKDEEVLVLEMGMNNLGEIKYLSDIAKPDIAVITNVLEVHIENLKTLDNVLKAKLEITSSLKDKLIINNDDPSLHNINIKNIDVITCGINNPSDYCAYNIDKDGYKVKINGEEFYFSNKVGTSAYVLNGLLAIAVGLYLNVDIKDIQKGISEYNLTEGRLEKTITKENITIIDDSYNASPESMKNGLEYLINEEGKRKIAILGDINELGERAEVLHKEVGYYLEKNPIDALITIGKHCINISNIAKSKMEDVYHFNTKDEANKFLKKYFKDGDIVLVKASNGNKFIEIVNLLKENY